MRRKQGQRCHAAGFDGGRTVASGSWRRPGNGLSPQASRQNWPCWDCGTSDWQNCKTMQLCCFEPLGLRSSAENSVSIWLLRFSFLHLVRWSCDFILYPVIVVYYINWYVYMLNQPCIPGINVTWSWKIIIFVQCQVILFRIFAFILIRDISL